MAISETILYAVNKACLKHVKRKSKPALMSLMLSRDFVHVSKRLSTVKTGCRPDGT